MYTEYRIHVAKTPTLMAWTAMEEHEPPPDHFAHADRFV